MSKTIRIIVANRFVFVIQVSFCLSSFILHQNRFSLHSPGNKCCCSKTYTFKCQIMLTGVFALSRVFVSSKSRNAVFDLYVLTMKADMPYLNILRYIILNILRYNCVFINNISIFCSLANQTTTSLEHKIRCVIKQLRETRYWLLVREIILQHGMARNFVFMFA